MNVFKLLLLSMFLIFSVNNAIGQPNHSFRFSVMGGNGFGINNKISNYSSLTLQPYRFGIGACVQYIFESNLSLGLIFVLHEGEAVMITTTRNPSPLNIKANIQYEGVELGYWIRFNQTLSMHPHVGLGVGERKGNFHPESGDIPDPNDVAVISVDGLRPYISPAASVIADITDSLFLGLEVNYLILTDYKNSNSFGTFLIAGINF